MTGVLDFDANNRSNWDVEQDIKKSPLWSYCGNSLALFKCPDGREHYQAVIRSLRPKEVPRVRSMSMNYWFGAFDGKHTEPFSLGPWRVYLKSSDLIDPGPNGTILFLDAREETVSSAPTKDRGGCRLNPRRSCWRSAGRESSSSAYAPIGESAHMGRARS